MSSSENSEFFHGWRGLALVARQQGDRAAALEHFRKAAAIDPANLWARQDVATELRELGRLDEAKAGFRDVVGRDPEFLHGWRGLALVARQQGDRAAALEHFRRAAAVEPENIWARQDVAMELRELGRLDEAEAVLKSLVEERPQSAQALIAYANGIRHKASTCELIELFKKAVVVEPDDLQAKLALAGEYFRSWRIEEAETLYGAALSIQGQNYAALMGMGQIARRRGQRAEALKLFEEAAASPGAPEWAVIEVSNELLEAARFEEARQIYLTALLRNPHLSAHHLQLGLIARATGDRSAARAAFAKTVELDPEADRAWMELAIEDFHQGRLKQAVDILKAVIAKHPRQAQALATLANFAQEIDDIEGSVSLAQRAIEIDASNTWSHLLLGHGLAKLGRYDEAEDALARCESKFGLLPEIEAARAGMLRDLGDYSAERAVLQKATTRFPTHLDLWSRHAMSLIACGVFDEAQRTVDAPPGCSARDQMRVCHLRGRLAYARWDLDKAYSYFAEGLKINADDAWLNEIAARMAMLRLDPDLARRHLDASVRNNSRHRHAHQGAWKLSQTLLGQIVDDFRMDKAALGRLRDCLTGEESVKEIAKLVLELPDYTPAAISFLIALRQKGFFASPVGLDRRPLTDASPIPLKIAQYWDDDIPADVEALCDAWRTMHPTFSYARFSDREARRYLDANGPAGARAAFDRAAQPAMKADLFRLAYLYREGGFYIDADDRCLAPLPTIGLGDFDLILHQEDWGTAGNNLIGVVPGHPAIKLALDAGIEAVNRGDGDIVWLSTGPGLLTRAVACFLAQDLPGRLRKTLLMERYELAEVVAMHVGTAYKHTQKHWNRPNRARTRAPVSIGMFLDEEFQTKA